MPRGKQPRGQCASCGHETTKGAMTKHLNSCQQRQQGVTKAQETTRKPETLYHLRIQDAYGGTYWFDAEVSGSTTLETLDSYLRAIWLECCGHLSQFSIGGWGGAELGFSRMIDTAFRGEDDLTHIYDFGTESVTLIKAMGQRQGVSLTRHPINLMARNLAPEVFCIDCEQQATFVCLECQEEGSTGFLCDEHAESHPHEEYGEPLEIFNSPRTGICGYDGPAEPPY